MSPILQHRRPAELEPSLISKPPLYLYLAALKMTQGYSRRNSSFLTLTPVEFSLTDGTNIPAPPDTPPKSPAPSFIPLARPPTAGGGPLSSHPTSAEDIRSATLPQTPDPENEPLAKMSTYTSSNNDMDRTDSFRTPDSPASAKQKQQKQGQTVRKLFSLNNLRNSFSSSRTSIQHQKENQNTSSVETSPQPPQADSFERPASGHNITPQMRPRAKSGSWFKRKSSMFMFNGNGDLDVVSEDRPATMAEGAKRVKEDHNTAPVHHPVSVRNTQISAPVQVQHSPAPLLPEIGSLGNGNMSGGDLGWDEGMFKR